MCSCGAYINVCVRVVAGVYVSVFVYVACRFSCVYVCVFFANVWYCVSYCCICWYACRVGWACTVVMSVCVRKCVTAVAHWHVVLFVCVHFIVFACMVILCVLFLGVWVYVWVGWHEWGGLRE